MARSAWEAHMAQLTPSQRKAIAKRYGHPVKDLGTGSMAHVWAMNDGRIVKITSSRSDAEVSAGLVGEKWPHVVRVYDVVRLGLEGRDEPEGSLWLISSERITPIDHDPREFDEIDRLYAQSRMNNSWSLNSMREALEALKALTPKPGYQDLHRQYVELIESLLELGLPAHDIGPWNLGWRDHELVVFDLGGDDVEANSPDVEVLQNAGLGREIGTRERSFLGYHGSYMTIGEVLDWCTGSSDPYMAAAALDLAQRLYGTTDLEELMGVTAGSAYFRCRVESLARRYRRQGHG